MRINLVYFYGNSNFSSVRHTVRSIKSDQWKSSLTGSHVHTLSPIKPLGASLFWNSALQIYGDSLKNLNLERLLKYPPKFRVFKSKKGQDNLHYFWNGENRIRNTRDGSRMIWTNLLLIFIPRIFGYTFENCPLS